MCWWDLKQQQQQKPIIEYCSFFFFPCSPVWGESDRPKWCHWKHRVPNTSVHRQFTVRVASPGTLRTLSQHPFWKPEPSEFLWLWKRLRGDLGKPYLWWVEHVCRPRGCAFSHVLIQPPKCPHFPEGWNGVRSLQRSADRSALRVTSFSLPGFAKTQVSLYSSPWREHCIGKAPSSCWDLPCHTQLSEGHPLGKERRGSIAWK